MRKKEIEGEKYGNFLERFRITLSLKGKRWREKIIFVFWNDFELAGF